MVFNSSMWLISSCGSPDSETRSMHCCKRQLRLSDDLEQRFVCVFVIFKSNLPAPPQHPISLHPSSQQPVADCFKSSSSIVSDTELTLGGGFSKALLMPSMIVSSYCETRCRSSVTEGGMGFSGCLVWYQKYRALWCTEAQRGSSHLQWKRSDRKKIFHNSQNKRGSWCFHTRKGWKYIMLLYV